MEDDEDQQALLALWLSGSNHTLTVFGTVTRMLEGLRQENFDALLLDWMLPDGSGAEVVQWVRRNIGWKIAVLVLTTCDDEATVVQALQAADDFVVKPPKQAELIARLSAAARRASPGGLLKQLLFWKFPRFGLGYW